MSSWVRPALQSSSSSPGNVSCTCVGVWYLRLCHVALPVELSFPAAAHLMGCPTYKPVSPCSLTGSPICGGEVPQAKVLLWGQIAFGKAVAWRESALGITTDPMLPLWDGRVLLLELLERTSTVAGSLIW